MLTTVSLHHAYSWKLNVHGVNITLHTDFFRHANTYKHKLLIASTFGSLGALSAEQRPANMREQCFHMTLLCSDVALGLCCKEDCLPIASMELSLQCLLSNCCCNTEQPRKVPILDSTIHGASGITPVTHCCSLLSLCERN